MAKIDDNNTWVQKEIQRINAEIKLEDAMAGASEILQFENFIKMLRWTYGDKCAGVFQCGFAAGYTLALDKINKQLDSIRQKHEQLQAVIKTKAPSPPPIVPSP